VVRCVRVGWVGVRPGMIRRGRCGGLRWCLVTYVVVRYGRRGELRLCVFCWGTFRQAGYVESW
jgi:hypothetical protein